MREMKVMTRDIDRVMRHEVLGQENSTSVADDSEFAWIKRVLPVIETLADKLFTQPLFGLRSAP
jgi:hypothetical protein